MSDILNKLDRITAVCPTSLRKIYVVDDWAPSYVDISGKAYVECRVLCGCYDDGVFYAMILFNGATTFNLKKEFESPDFSEVVKAYKKYKKYAKKIRHNLNLKTALCKEGFVPLEYK